MTFPIPTIPSVTDPRFLEFCEFLRNAPVKPAGGMDAANYVDHLSVLEVPVVPQPGCPLGHCWNNCLDQQLAKGGEAIYGWSLFQDGSRFIAQHHAIWQSGQGQYLDPTPNQLGSAIALFMPDNRAPFDIAELRSPASLEWHSNGKVIWFAGPVSVDHFFIARMVPSAQDAIRIHQTRQRLAELA
ncbi:MULTISPECIES: hypothetical protein [Pseudomonas]|nr:MULTISPECIES: hypothetical protein [Pseudomonas]